MHYKSYLLAALLTFGLVGWMFLDYLPVKNDDTVKLVALSPVSSTPDTNNGVNIQAVEVRTQISRDVEQSILSQGQVEPSRVIKVRAETAGQVSEIVAIEGQPIKTGDVLVRIKMDDRQARLKKAEALVLEQSRNYDRAKAMGKKGLQSQSLIDEKFSNLQTARADLEEIKLEIENTTIRAPFDGILETRDVELGEYVTVNGDIGVIVDNDPLIVSVQIAQQDVGQVSIGDVADIKLGTGQTSEGKVRFIAPRADSKTRTFRVELEVPNPGNRFLSGASAEVRIPIGTTRAQFVSPALLSLDDADIVGVKTVTDEEIVVFNPVTIVVAEVNGIWVNGLPDKARIITVGQGFVQAGDVVRAIEYPSAGTKDGTVFSGVMNDMAAHIQ
ncbi:MAG: hemolysin D [marine bacterium B5-7]|nr:MAG: hemolysin D [marine bacterium B5-7]